MKITEVIELVNGTLLNKNIDYQREIMGGCGADLMSDVLASVKPEAALLTGLCNPQVIRTAQMADLSAVILVRGKTPPPETIELADKENIPIITSPFGMFELCGILHGAGLPCYETSLAVD